MKWIALIIGCVFGLAAGTASALAAAGIVGPGMRLGGVIDANGWLSDWTVGSPSANPWTRAYIARRGLLALTKEEAVYFTRAKDDTGQPLTEDCTYRVSGETMPALWWSVTLYDAKNYLPPNTDQALAYDLTKATNAGQAENWSFLVAPVRPAEGNWVSSRSADNFDLTLRLYKPDAALLDDPESVLTPPSIERLSCGGQS
ncbi:MAG: DUF1214 domain-containing protein [Hyphomonas oceanitis]|uniref:DUF1214 domain-containing protein n=1 Tax=Hyphomonas oceanitis TaxID=81033 RepID=UPI0030015ADC